MSLLPNFADGNAGVQRGQYPVQGHAGTFVTKAKPEGRLFGISGHDQPNAWQPGQIICKQNHDALEAKGAVKKCL